MGLCRCDAWLRTGNGIFRRMNNADKIILDLCGGTGSWSKPYTEAGYDVRLLTLPDYDVTKWRLLFQMPDIRELILGGKVYGILAAPPCTMFSRARTRASTPRDFEGAMAIVKACLDIVWTCRTVPGTELKFWALENPMGMLRQFLGNPPHHFRGWEYGDEHVKFTDLWGYYKMPRPKVKEQIPFNQKIYASPKKPAQYAHLKLDRAAIRAITPPGFAKAFMEANK